MMNLLVCGRVGRCFQFRCFQSFFEFLALLFIAERTHLLCNMKIQIHVASFVFLFNERLPK